MEIINPLEFLNWDDLLGSNPAGSFFHTTNWAHVLKESYGYTPRYFSILEKGSLKALIPVMEINSILTGRRGVSLPFSDYSEPFAADGEEYRTLARDIVACGRKSGWKTIEVRGGECPWQEPKASTEFFGHRLRLGFSENELFSRLRTNMQRNIKKSTKLGVKVDFLNTMDAVCEFYRLNCITRKDHGIPPQPLEFFRKIHEHVLSRDLGFVALASYQGKTIAGAVYFHFGRKAIYKYGATDQAGKTHRANNLVMWEAIKWYRERNYSQLCFGRTECENSGLRDYKLGYGTEEYILSYYKYDFDRRSIVEKNKSDLAYLNQAYRHIPIPISKVIGNLLYKHIG